MGKIKFISFDLDGTLVDPSFTTWVWEVGIPKLYAQKHKLPLSEAVSVVINGYQRIGDSSLEWYDIKYWFERFALPGNWKDLLEEHRKRIRLYPEVKEVLEILRKHYKLVIISNAAREFVEMEVKETGIEEYFSHIFSATSDFKQVKKTSELYAQICKIIKITPSQMIHVGDHYEFDYLAPKELGIKTYFLDRNGTKPNNNFTLKNLKDFMEVFNQPFSDQLR